MSGSGIALAIIFAIIFTGTATGILAGRHRKMDLEQWTVAGRGFGLVFVWILSAGEIYTSYTFLGVGGWAYSRGGPVLYALAYCGLSYVVAFYILPPIWTLGRRHGLQTQADFFQARYGSKYLAAFVSIVGVGFLIPNLQLQLTGLGIIMQVASFEGISRAPAMLAAGALLTSFVLISGVRGVAWVSVLKDALMLAAALIVGIGVPHIFFGGFGPMFTALAHVNPAHLTMPGSTPNLGHTWFISTVLVNSFGFYMWPHGFAASYTAKSADTLRRNAVIMPVYSVTLALMIIVGFAAILVAPGIGDPDLALLTTVRKAFPPWMLGIIGGAGALTAMVPSAILILTASASFAKNLYRPIFAPGMTDDAVARLARIIVVPLSVISLYLAIYRSATLVSLLLLGYSGMVQFFPGVVLGLFWKRVSQTAVFSGMAVGVVTVVALALFKMDPLWGFNGGFVGLCLNCLITWVMSMLAPPAPALPEEAAFSSASTLR
jgi:SSS family solute:Na+ symporter